MKTFDKTNLVIKSFMKKDTFICCVVSFFPQKKKKKSKWVVPASCIVSMDKQGLKGTHPFSMDMVKLASTIDTKMVQILQWWQKLEYMQTLSKDDFTMNWI